MAIFIIKKNRERLLELAKNCYKDGKEQEKKYYENNKENL